MSYFGLSPETCYLAGFTVAIAVLDMVLCITVSILERKLDRMQNETMNAFEVKERRIT